MESFQVNGKYYLVRWSHSDPTVTPRSTLCEIYEDLGEIKTAEPISYAWATLAKEDKDKFCKRIGRKLSFQRALYGVFNKQEREMVWDYAICNFDATLIDGFGKY